MRRRFLTLAPTACLALVVPSVGRSAPESLPRIGPAPDFTLINQEGQPVASRSWRGKVTVVTFLFTGCSQTCPLLTAKLVGIQKALGPAGEVQFAAISVDPLNDTPSALKAYAQAHSADLSRFAFLTGTMAQIDDVVRRYAVYRRADPGGNVDHTFLTSIVDRKGTLRVQYIGTRFDPKEFLADLRAVLAEKGSG